MRQVVRVLPAALAALLFMGCGTSAPRVGDSTSVDVSPQLPTSSITVFRSYPADRQIDGVWIVMSGTDRNADEYRDYWAEAAVGTRLLVLAPEFDREDFPGSNGYNLANMLDDEDDANPEDHWLFGAIEDVFAAARDEFGFAQRTYRLYGHSAGAQFVTRMVTFAPESAICRAYPANAGWYTVTDDRVRFPYGLADAPPPGADLREAFSVPMTLLLGADDTDTEDENLRRDKRADAQGKHRLERGQYYFEVATAEATDLGVPLAWDEEIVPGVAHDGRAMSQVALALSRDDPECR